MLLSAGQPRICLASPVPTLPAPASWSVGWRAGCAGPACKALRTEPWLDLLIGVELMDRQPGVGRTGRTRDGEQE